MKSNTFKFIYTKNKNLKRFEQTICTIPYYPIKIGFPLEIKSWLNENDPPFDGGAFNTLELSTIINVIENDDTLILETANDEYHFERVYKKTYI